MPTCACRRSSARFPYRWTRTHARGNGRRSRRRSPGSLEFAAAVGSRSVYLCTGSMASLTWEEAADAFCEAIAPLTPLSDALGVPLAVEATNSLLADVSFVYSLRDALDLARAAGVKVVLDVFSCWYERGLEELVRKNVDQIALVQLSDFVIGTHETGNRVVPGDGDLPLCTPRVDGAGRRLRGPLRPRDHGPPDG